MSFRGAAKCCVCKRFCSAKKLCQGCGKYCHDKCRQQLCCNPCNNCWAQVLTKRSCVCGTSLRCLGVFVERQQQPLTPSTSINLIVDTPSQMSTLPVKRNSDRMPRLGAESDVRKTLHYDTDTDIENQAVTMLTMHPHEVSRDYLMRVQERGGNNSRDLWEDCRLLNKYKVKSAAGRETVWCTIECRIRKDLKETAPWRPSQPIRWVYCTVTSYHTNSCMSSRCLYVYG